MSMRNTREVNNSRTFANTKSKRKEVGYNDQGNPYQTDIVSILANATIMAGITGPRPDKRLIKGAIFCP